jgi:hypothetical protein
MDILKRVEKLQGQINSQKAIKAQFEKEGNEIGARGAQKKIEKYEKEIRDLA